MTMPIRSKAQKPPALWTVHVDDTLWRPRPVVFSFIAVPTSLYFDPPMLLLALFLLPLPGPLNTRKVDPPDLAPNSLVNTFERGARGGRAL